MYLLYLDDSGSVGNAADNYVILAGVAVFERLPYWFSQKMNGLAARVVLGLAPAERRDTLFVMLKS